MTVQSWQSIAADKQASLRSQLEQGVYHVPRVEPEILDVVGLSLDDYLTPRQVELTLLPPETLCTQLASGKLSSVEVIEAFLQRASIAHGLINCLCVAFFETALKRARDLDQYLATTGQPVGPLHGLPISLKNQIDVRDQEMNMCYVGRSGCIAEEDSALVKILQSQGAVLYCLTNLSQGLLSSDTVNNLYGRTVSPFNRDLCVGGSSGGEGGLIALKGSPLGVGSDLGGSIRMPAAFNGLYGFRPSSNRIPYAGAHNSQQGQESNASCLGPISPSVNGLKLFVKAVLDAKPWTLDPIALHMPWNEDAYRLSEHGGKDRRGAKLCFGLAWNNGDVTPHPPYRRAMEMTRTAILKAGHCVVDISFPVDSETGHNIYLDMLMADGGGDLRRECEVSGEPVYGGTVKGRKGRGLSAHGWWDLSYKRRLWITKQLEVWQATVGMTDTGRPVDGIITPVAPYPSFRHGEEEYVWYTALSNICDFPTSTFPVTKVDPRVDVACTAQTMLSEWDRRLSERYDPGLFRGMPIGLQLIGRKGEDEAVLRMTEIIATALAGE